MDIGTYSSNQYRGPDLQQMFSGLARQMREGDRLTAWAVYSYPDVYDIGDVIWC